MKHTSVKLDSPCEFVNVSPLNPLISKCQIKVCYVGEDPNRNGSIITKEVAAEMANSLPGSPIVGFFSEEKDDFEGHEKEIEITEDGELKFAELTKPYGFVDINAKVWFQKFADDGVEHEYLMTEGYLWTGQYPEVERVLDGNNGQSMELDSNSVKGTWVKVYNENTQFFIINEAVISKLCILGEDIEPCFEGASIKTEFSFGEEFNQNLLALIQAVKEYQMEGGVIVPEQEKEVLDETKVEETPIEEEVIETEEEEKVEETPEVEVEEEKVEEDEKVQYNLEEIEEYVELVEKYQALEQEIETLKVEKETLENQVSELSAFKLKVDREQKEKMIKEEFYMLSDKDKEDVIQNIDNYSLDEIEAKLSVICVRNKVSFSFDEDTNDGVVSYSVDNYNASEDLIPGWIKAVKERKGGKTNG